MTDRLPHSFGDVLDDFGEESWAKAQEIIKLVCGQSGQVFLESERPPIVLLYGLANALGSLTRAHYEMAKSMGETSDPQNTLGLITGLFEIAFRDNPMNLRLVVAEGGEC
jgi:hypothetical protein